MPIIELIRQHIIETGRDGLCNIFCECGCSGTDLAPCDGIQPGCVPAFDIGETPDGDSHYFLIRDKRPTPEEVKDFWIGEGYKID
ncbi:MAG: hypothetical protein VST70_06955 [Nitrospirota bacterium]|nr:hypothetical protein [Nitrospirota bacterium]